MIGLFYPNRARSASITGGSWLASRPVTKVGGDDITDVARSTNALASSTKILLDLGASYAMRAFAMVNSNLSDGATYVIKVGTSSGAGDVLTTDSLPAWYLASESAVEAIGAKDTSPYHLRKFHQIYVHASTISGRYVSFEISDPSNPAGYVDVGRVFVGGGYVPNVNYSYGGKEGWRDLSSSSASESGAVWKTRRRRMRTAEFMFEHRTQAEADILHDMMRIVGTTDDVLYVPDIEDLALSQRYGYVGTLRELYPISNPQWNSRGFNFAIDEIT